MTAPRLTPMFEQYLRIKEEYPDALLFYRMGDFYELFFDDAEVASRELSITLTSRNPNAEAKVPMCGVPHHAAEGYLAQLLDKGYRVAICDQVEDPKQAKGLVRREVTRVLTPGTVIEDANLPARDSNYLAALYWDEVHGAGGAAWADVSTGHWSGLSSTREPELWQWLVKIGARELLLPQGRRVPTAFADMRAQVTPLPERGAFDLDAARRNLLEAQGVADLDALGLSGKPELTRACGALLFYLRQTQKQDVSHLEDFRPLDLSHHLILDEVTERNLEIFRRLDGRSGSGTLVHVLDRTVTPLGARLLAGRLREPWRDPTGIGRCLDCVEFFFGRDAARAELRRALDEVHDLERLSTRVQLGRATPRDFAALRQSLLALPRVRQTLAAETGEIPAELRGVLQSWDDMSDLAAHLDAALVDNPPLASSEGGLFKIGFNPELDDLIQLTEHGEARVRELFEQERTASGIPKLKLGFNKVFGYYFEVSKAHQGAVPESFIRRQTLVNCERYVTPRLKELEDRLLSASEERKALEYTLFLELRETLAQARARFVFMAGALAGLDYWQGLAEAARLNSWTRPEIHNGLEIEIEGGRHPVVEAAQGAANYVPNDVRLDESRRILLITGPNMAGKSTVLRQTAVITLMAQIGSFVPAARARIGVADRIFSRVGASDNLAQGQSTFMVEMMETARILRQATRRSLVILDEIGRGTSTFDGLALAWAVAEDLAKRAGGVRTLFATHYHELTSLEGKLPGLRNLNIAVREWKGEIVFLRRLVPGPADKSYGIEVARLAGVPRPVVERAREILANLEEKSQDARTRGTLLSRQSSLPGLDREVVPGPGEESPLAKALRDLDVDGLTPIQALTLLHQWKQTFKDGR